MDVVQFYKLARNKAVDYLKSLSKSIHKFYTYFNSHTNTLLAFLN